LVEEVRSWIGLAHPHVVQAFDVRDDETTDYHPAIIMDFCAGGSLAGRIYGGRPLSVAEGLDVAIQVCWAMEYLHGQRLVHRDLKSQNVLLVTEGNLGAGKALVADLGLAKALGAHGLESAGQPRDDAEADLWVTVSAAGGTPTHMAPEQWMAGSHVGMASDVYAFGVLLYEIFCRQLPFPGGQDLRQLQVAHLDTAVPEPRQWNGEIPTGLSELMRQCLAKKAEARPRDFTELSDRFGRLYYEALGRDYTALRVKPSGVALTAETKARQIMAKVRLGLGAQRRGDLETASREFEEAQKAFRNMGDKNGLAVVLGTQANFLGARGDLEGAVALLKQAEQICRELGNRDGLQTALGSHAAMLAVRGDLDGAMALNKQAEQICRELGNKAGLQLWLSGQGMILKVRGDFDGAMTLLEEAEQICRELGDKKDLQASLEAQASVLEARGDPDGAVALLKQAEQICRELGDKVSLQFALGTHALILSDRGDWDGAIALLKEQEQICRELGNRKGWLLSMSNRAYIMAAHAHKQLEESYRQSGNAEGLATSLLAQAEVLGLKLERRAIALSKGEEALKLCSQAGLAQLAEKVQAVLDQVRARGG
jgi:tetratricopeptide (TPR) repeat protein